MFISFVAVIIICFFCYIQKNNEKHPTKFMPPEVYAQLSSSSSSSGVLNIHASEGTHFRAAIKQNLGLSGMRKNTYIYI